MPDDVPKRDAYEDYLQSPLREKVRAFEESRRLESQSQRELESAPNISRRTSRRTIFYWVLGVLIAFILWLLGVTGPMGLGY